MKAVFGRVMHHSGKRNPVPTAEQKAAARQAWVECRPMREVKEKLGALNDHFVYKTAKAEGWPPRTQEERNALKREATNQLVPMPEPPPPTMGATPLRRCWSCEKLTTQEPCAHCGARWENA